MRTLPILLMLASTPLAASAAAQDALEEAKAHYAAAAYEEALSTLTRVEKAPLANKVEVEQYRAFCLIALGRLPEAERAVASLVAVDPKYVPSATVASPRVLQLVSDMRRKELPGIARRLLDEGRAAYQDKQFERAEQTFALLLQLLEDPALKGRPENEDMRVLAQGFVTLADAAAAPPPAPAQSETPAPTPEVSRLEPPIAINQALPEWAPPDDLAASRDFVGSVRVTIGTDGRVKAAAIDKPTYPTYDARLLQAAKTWLYKPARRNGEPVESEKVIAINLRRRN
jgi:tetratricopeptide (TPR) repeat protein